MSDSERAAIEVEDVGFHYVEDTEVLRGIDLTVHRGEFVTIIGQNGSGKSTLLKHFNGLLKPNSGLVRIHTPSGETLDTREASMRTLSTVVGHVFQNPDDQIFHTSIIDELTYGLDNIGVAGAEQERRVGQVLEQVDLAGRQYDNPFVLGKGERQRLALAGVLVMEPSILCVDEPTTGQDPKEARRIMDILEQYNERGNTVIAITHDMSLAAAYTDRLIVLQAGQILADGHPAEVFVQRENLEETNIRPPQITRLWTELEERVPGDALGDLWLTVDDAFDELV